MSEENRNIREYSFNVPGFIPGVPHDGLWPAGSRVTIDEDTKEVLDIWPKPVESVPPAVSEEEPQGIH